MFKRVEKRRRKKEEEEELGLNEEMKEVLGMHDTDSEESASESDDDNSDDDDENDEAGQNSDDETFLEGDLAYEDREENDDEDEDEDEDQGLSDKPVITVQEALRDPVYIISLDPMLKGCILCPGKILKGGKMDELHKTSNAYGKMNAWDILAEQAKKDDQKQGLNAPSATSKRALKREAQAAMRKARRDKQKARAREKKANQTSAKEAPATLTELIIAPPLSQANSPPRPKKKQKVSEPPSSANTTVDPPAPSDDSVKNVKSIAAIARSASDRAKTARVKAIKADTKPKPKTKRSS